MKRFIRRLMRWVGFDVLRLRPYLLLVPLAAADDVAGPQPLEQYRFERRLSAVLQKLCVNCVLDVGANEGQYGLMLRRLGYTGHIISFEPGQAAWDQLRRVAGRDARWTAHRLALGSTQAHARLHVMAGSDFSSFLEPTASSLALFPASAPVVHDEDVEMARLDEILPHVAAHVARPRFFLKMDTQGYDLEVFAGAQRVLDRITGLQSELAVVPLYEHVPTMLTALQTYQAAGFELSDLAAVSRDPTTARVLEYDCLMVREDSG